MAESRFRSLFPLLNCVLLVVVNASPETDQATPILCNVSTPVNIVDFAAVLANCYDECTTNMIPIFEKSEGYAEFETTSAIPNLPQTKTESHGNIHKEEDILNGKREDYLRKADANPVSKTIIVSDVIYFGKTSEESENALLQNIEQLESYTYDCNTNQATAIFRNVPTPSKLGDYSAMLADRYDECSSSMIPYYCEESEGEADFETLTSSITLNQIPIIPSAKTESHGDIHKEEETLNQKHAEHLHHENANPTYQTNIDSGAIHFGRASEGPVNALFPDCAGPDPMTGDLTTNQATPILSNVAIYSAMLADSYDECSSIMIPYYCEESEGDAGFETTRTTLGLLQTDYEAQGNVQKEEMLNREREEYLRHADENPKSKNNIVADAIDLGRTSEERGNAFLPDCERLEPTISDSKPNQATAISTPPNLGDYADGLADCYCEESKGYAEMETTRTTLNLAKNIPEAHGNIQKDEEILNGKREYLRHADTNPLSKTNVPSDVINIGKASGNPGNAVLPDREDLEPYTCDLKTHQTSAAKNLPESQSGNEKHLENQKYNNQRNVPANCVICELPEHLRKSANVEDPVLEREIADAMKGSYNPRVCICYLPTTQIPEAQKAEVITQTKLLANGLDHSAKELNAEKAEMNAKHGTDLQESDVNTPTEGLEFGAYADSLLPCYDERSPLICYLPTSTTLSAEQVGVQDRASESLANKLGASHQELDNIQAMKNAKRGIVTGEKYPHINAKGSVWRNEKSNIMPDKDDSSEHRILDSHDNAGDFITICYLHASIFLGSTPNAFM